MYSVQNKYSRFCKLTGKYNNIITNINNNHLLEKYERHIYLSGVINSLWQAWNDFWRTFWLANLFGGYDIRRNLIAPIPSILKSKSSESEALFYLLYVLGKRRNAIGSISGSYQEATWGDRTQIEKLTLNLKGPGDSILSAMAIYGNAIYHLQLVRNASIHLDMDNFKRAKSELMPYYIYPAIKYPTDFLFSTNLSNGEIAYKDWVNNLKVFLSFT